MKKTRLNAYCKGIVANNLLNLFNNNSDINHRMQFVDALCNIIDDFHESCVNELIMENMEEKVKQHIKKVHRKEVMKIEKDIIKFKGYPKLIKDLEGGVSIDCKIYKYNNVKVLHINLNYFDLSRIEDGFFVAMTEEIRRRYKKYYKDVVINFNNCSIGRDVFDIIKNSRYDKSEKTSEIVKNRIEINGIKINYNNFYLKDVDLTKYSFNELLDKNKMPGLDDKYFYLMLLKNALNYETLIEVINFIKRRNEEQKISSLNLTGLSVKELEEFYEENKNAAYFRTMNGHNYNGIKLNKEHVKKIIGLRDSETYLGRTRGDLHGFDLNRIWLDHICFNGANLNDANLVETIFWCSNLENVICNDMTIFSRNCLSRARISIEQVKIILNLRVHEETYLGRTTGDLRGFNLSDLDLSELDLSKANLCGTCLRRAHMYNVNLESANLECADLERATLSFAILKKANLTEVYSEKAILIGADLREAKLIEAKLREANLQGANLEGADLKMANLGCANLKVANLKGANLVGAGLFRANLSEADLRGADLRGAYFGGVDLRGADLRGADLSGVDLSEAIIDENTKFENAKLNETIVTKEQLGINEDLRINFEKCNSVLLANINRALFMLRKTFNERSR